MSRRGAMCSVGIFAGRLFRNRWTWSSFAACATLVCDACRGAVTGELKKEAGIRAVRFEGADRKELVVGHVEEQRRSDIAKEHSTLRSR